MATTKPQQQFPPKKVGNQFLFQYFKLLNKAPQYLHRFYRACSLFKFDDSKLVMGQKQINEIIEQQKFKNCTVNITNTVSQATVNDGVLIQVVGRLFNEGQSERPFKQTFILVRLSEKRYYVHNHIFRYEDRNTAIENKEDNSVCLKKTVQKSVEKRPVKETLTNTKNITKKQQTKEDIIAKVVAATDFSVPPPPLIINLCSMPPPSMAKRIILSTQQEVSPKAIPSEPLPIEEFPSRLQQDMKPKVKSNEVKTIKDSPTLTQEPNAEKLPLLNASTSEKSLLSTVSDSAVQREESKVRIEGFGTILEQQEEEDEAAKQGSDESKTYANLFKGNCLPPNLMNAQKQQQPQILQQQLTGYQTNPGNFAQFLEPPSTSIAAFNNSFATCMDNSMAVGSQATGIQQRNSTVRIANRPGFFRDTQQLFLGNIPHHATEHDLKMIFQRFGRIVELRVLSKQGGKTVQGHRTPLNYGFLTYEREDSVQMCLANCPIFFPESSPNGQRLNVEIKKPRNRNNNDMQRNRSQTASMGDPNMLNSSRNNGGGQQQQQHQQQQNTGGNKMRRNNSTGGIFNRNENRSGGQLGRGSITARR